MGDREEVLSAIDAVIALNREAGVDSKSLNAVVKAASETNAKAHFDKFCSQIVAAIHKCFVHSSSVLPQLAKTRAHRDFHQARLSYIPGIWQQFSSATGLETEPLNLQAVSRQLFDQSMKKFFMMLKPPVVECEVKLLADEENAVRYASGYVGMKLMKQLKNVKGAKAAQFRECLSQMSRTGEDKSFLDYTREWMESLDRGGLFDVSDDTFELVKAIEVKTRKVLPQYLAGSAHSSKKELLELVVCDEMVQLKWKSVGADIVDDEDANDLLHQIVDMWITMRGFSITSKWMEDYKLAKNKTVKKAKSLRRELKSDD